MSLLTVEGTYDNGRVELSERPAGVGRSRVLVTFLHEGHEGAELRRAAGARLLEAMREGLSFGGVPFSRGDVYEERQQELERRRAEGA